MLVEVAAEPVVQLLIVFNGLSDSVLSSRTFEQVSYLSNQTKIVEQVVDQLRDALALDS